MNIEDQTDQSEFTNTLFGDMDGKVSSFSDRESESECGDTQLIQFINAEDTYNSEIDF